MNADEHIKKSSGQILGKACQPGEDAQLSPIDRLNDMRFVMVNTSHAGNIGSAARAVKTMGITDLTLVKPDQFPAPQAQWLASGATDVLDKAKICSSVQEAIADCVVVIGTSARQRRIPVPQLTPHSCAHLVRNLPKGQKVAFLFGREASGLDNEALDRCHYHMSIPANPDYPVLNVAMAVQIVAYALRQAFLDGCHMTNMTTDNITTDNITTDNITTGHMNTGVDRMPVQTHVNWDVPLATSDATERFLEHLNSVLIDIEFIDPNNPRQAMRRLRRLFKRVHLDEMEVGLLRGILSAVEKKCLPAISRSEDEN